MMKPTKDLGAAMFRLTRAAPWLLYRGDGRSGYGGSIEADLRAVLIALADKLDAVPASAPTRRPQ